MSPLRGIRVISILLIFALAGLACVQPSSPAVAPLEPGPPVSPGPLADPEDSRIPIVFTPAPHNDGEAVDSRTRGAEEDSAVDSTVWESPPPEGGQAAVSRAYLETGRPAGHSTGATLPSQVEARQKSAVESSVVPSSMPGQEMAGGSHSGYAQGYRRNGFPFDWGSSPHGPRNRQGTIYVPACRPAARCRRHGSQGRRRQTPAMGHHFPRQPKNANGTHFRRRGIYFQP